MERADVIWQRVRLVVKENAPVEVAPPAQEPSRKSAGHLSGIALPLDPVSRNRKTDIFDSNTAPLSSLLGIKYWIHRLVDRSAFPASLARIVLQDTAGFPVIFVDQTMAVEPLQVPVMVVAA